MRRDQDWVFLVLGLGVPLISTGALVATLGGLWALWQLFGM